MTDRAPSDLDQLAADMENDGMPQAATWLRRVVDPSIMAEWRMAEARRCFVWGVVVGVLLVLAVQVWGRVLLG